MLSENGKNGMINPSHDKDGFFKYYTANSAKLTLTHTSRKWSTPRLFNDPFDNQFNLYYEEPSEELAEQQLRQFHEIITSPESLKANQFGPMTPKVEIIRQVRLQNPDLKYTDDEMAYLREGVIEGMRRVIKNVPTMNAEIRGVMADTAVFCLSETHDNLLMWSHYAQNHTGTVIKFLALAEIDAPTIVAQPVRYSRQMPQLDFAALMDFEKVPKEIINMVTLTKSEVWAYEKEWRIIGGLRDKTQSYDVLPYAPEEVGAVYLGCNIAKEDKEEIIEVTRRLYSKAKLFQAEKHEREFALTFNEIT
jgi:hypothetical protein